MCANSQITADTLEKIRAQKKDKKITGKKDLGHTKYCEKFTYNCKSTYNFLWNLLPKDDEAVAR